MGFGGASQANPLLAFQLESNLQAGRRAQAAYDLEAQSLREQSNLFVDEADRDAAIKQAEVEQYASNQAEQYLSSGVLLDGSPLAVIEQTRQRGKQEIDAIRRRGDAQARLYRLKADSQQRAGLESLLTVEAENTTTKLKADQQKRLQKMQTLKEIGGIGLGIGKALLAGAF